MRRSRWSRTLVVLLLATSMLALVGAGPPPGRPTPGQAAFAPGRILVKFQTGVSAAQKAATHRAQGAHVLEVIPGIDVQVLSVPAGAEKARVAAYARSPLVAYAEPDYIAHALGQPDDEFFDLQWGLHNPADTDIDAPEAWDLAMGLAEIKIAILDTGIDQNHPDLPADKLVGDKNFTNSRTVDDLYGHGTHVAGIAAAETDNSEGVAGVGYNSSLLNVKVLNDRGSGRYSWIADGIVWAANYGANVINMSLGGYSYSETLELAVDHAWQQGVVLAAAAGNDGISDKLYPAAYANCIAVAATDDDDQRVDEPGWWASNYGTWVDVAAPGLYIYSTIPNHDSRIWGTPDETPYDYGSGTSMATPFVSGLAGLLWAQGYGSNAAVRSQIQNTADAIPGTGDYWVHGRINACEAVGGTCDGPVDNDPPVADAGGPYDGTEDVAITFEGSGSYDPDGDPLTHTWDFGDGTTAIGVSPSHAYRWGGSFIVTLTVDDGNAMHSDTTSASVEEVNDTPVADPNGPYSGTVGEPITFDGSASSDFDNEDGTDANDQGLTYTWDFGDGNTGTGVSPSHAYNEAGTYQVSLVVNDEEVDSVLASTEVTVSEVGATMHVGDLDGVSSPFGRSGWIAEVTILMHGVSDDAVDDATVSGTWSDGYSGAASCTTGADGECTVATNRIRKNESSVTFTVNTVTHDTLTYDAGANHDPDGDSDPAGTTIIVIK